MQKNMMEVKNKNGFLKLYFYLIIYIEMGDSGSQILNKKEKTLYKNVINNINQINNNNIFIRIVKNRDINNKNYVYLKSITGYNVYSQSFRYNLIRGKILHNFECYKDKSIKNQNHNQNHNLNLMQLNKSLLFGTCNAT